MYKIKAVLILIFLSFVVLSNIEAQNALETDGKVYHIGLLLQSGTNEPELVIGNPFLKHIDILEKYRAQTSSKVDKILWAGELEQIDGQVTRVNETAGLTREKEALKLNQGIEFLPNGIKNIEEYILANEQIKEKYFNSTKYISYSKENEHLSNVFASIAYLRHNLIMDLVKMLQTVDNERFKFNDHAPGFLAISYLVLKHYKKVINIYPSFNFSEWQALEAYLNVYLKGYPDANTNGLNDCIQLFILSFRQILSNDLFYHITVIRQEKSSTDPVNEKPELLTDDKVITLLDEAASVADKNKELVLLERVEALIESRQERNDPVSSAVINRYRQVKQYIEGGEKDVLIFDQRLKQDFNLQKNETDKLIKVLLEKNGGILLTEKEVQIFFGTKERNYQDSLYNKIKTINNEELSTNLFLLSLMILGNNMELAVNGKNIDVKNHMTEFMMKHDGLFEKLDLFVLSNKWQEHNSLKFNGVLKRFDLIRQNMQTLRVK